MGFMRKNHCDLFCSHVKSCACIDGWVWVSFGMFPSVCTISLLSETSKCKWPHITCQDVRHASWGNSECDLYRKCESSIKVWGTHLRMNERERDGFLFFCDWLSRCVACPSCILARASRNGYTKLSLDVLRVLWRMRQCQVKCLPPRTCHSLDRERLWSQVPNMGIKTYRDIKKNIASRLWWTGKVQNEIDAVHPGTNWMCRSLARTIQQKSWQLAQH